MTSVTNSGSRPQVSQAAGLGLRYLTEPSRCRRHSTTTSRPRRCRHVGQPGSATLLSKRSNRLSNFISHPLNQCDALDILRSPMTISPTSTTSGRQPQAGHAVGLPGGSGGCSGNLPRPLSGIKIWHVATSTSPGRPLHTGQRPPVRPSFSNRRSRLCILIVQHPRHRSLPGCMHALHGTDS
jgi:hypothetical protein